jgi:hypothetical protein
MSKVQAKVYLEPELAEMITAATLRFKSAGRNVSRNDVIVQLLQDGFRFWRQEADMAARVEGSVGKLTDEIRKQKRVLETILLSIAEGNVDEYKSAIKEIYGDDDAA